MKSAAEDFPFQYGDPKDQPQTACGAMVAGERLSGVTVPGAVEDRLEQTGQAVPTYCNAGPEPRNRRERPRMSDIERTVEKKYNAVYAGTTLPYLAVGADKNTPESLKTLRWAIYELIETYEADYSKTISGILKQEVERLFKEYTHS